MTLILGGIFLLTNFHDKSVSSTSISSVISHLASQNKFAKIKIIHDKNLDPMAYAIGFGCKTNASLIVGGINEDDWFTSSLLISFARTICEAIHQNESLLGINLNKLFSKKGLWIIPSMASSDPIKPYDIISEKLDPRRLIELKLSGETIRYHFGMKTPPNSKLMAYIFASSCGYLLDRKKSQDDDELCNWFVNELSRPAFSINVGRECDLSPSDVEPILTRLLESFLLFIAA